MKKALVSLAAAAIILSMGVTGAFAAGPCGHCFTDADGDGVCDNAAGHCAYVDADGDGVCDNYASGRGRGCGYGRGARSGHGKGARCGRGR